MLTGDPDRSDPLVVTHDGPIATLWLNRPEKRNAVTKSDVGGHRGDVRRPRHRRATCVCSSCAAPGDHFCGGADIGELAVSDASYAAANAGADHALGSFPKPTVAFIQGLVRRWRHADRDRVRRPDRRHVGRFGITPARLGIVYPAFAVDRAVRLLGPSATKHLLFSAELIGRSARCASASSTRCTSRPAADERIDAFATLLADRAIAAHPRCRARRWSTSACGPARSRGRRRRGGRPSSRRAPIRAEGVAAFLERRSPRFTWAGTSD